MHHSLAVRLTSGKKRAEPQLNASFGTAWRVGCAWPSAVPSPEPQQSGFLDVLGCSDCHWLEEDCQDENCIRKSVLIKVYSESTTPHNHEVVGKKAPAPAFRYWALALV